MQNTDTPVWMDTYPRKVFDAIRSHMFIVKCSWVFWLFSRNIIVQRGKLRCDELIVVRRLVISHVTRDFTSSHFGRLFVAHHHHHPHRHGTTLATFFIRLEAHNMNTENYKSKKKRRRWNHHVDWKETLMRGFAKDVFMDLCSLKGWQQVMSMKSLYRRNSFSRIHPHSLSSRITSQKIQPTRSWQAEGNTIPKAHAIWKTAKGIILSNTVRHHQLAMLKTCSHVILTMESHGTFFATGSVIGILTFKGARRSYSVEQPDKKDLHEISPQTATCCN